MAIIATVKQHDSNGNKTLNLKKFIPVHLMAFEGSAGFGGKEVNDVIKAAKAWATDSNHVNDNDGDHIVVIDTQSPAGTSQHSYCLFPAYHEEDDYQLTWERS